MIVLNKKGFKLPRVEKDKFILLLRLGLAYNREQGTYSISNLNNIEKLTDALASILNTGKVSFTQTCITCSKDFACSECKYYELCETRDLPFHCVCTQCLRKNKPLS
jgi:hypothetical protein